jgi:hypothetical protein
MTSKFIIVAAPGFYGDWTEVIATAKTKESAIRSAKRACGNVFRAVAYEVSGYRKGQKFFRVNAQHHTAVA